MTEIRLEGKATAGEVEQIPEPELQVSPIKSNPELLRERIRRLEMLEQQSDEAFASAADEVISCLASMAAGFIFAMILFGWTL